MNWIQKILTRSNNENEDEEHAFEHQEKKEKEKNHKEQYEFKEKKIIKPSQRITFVQPQIERPNPTAIMPNACSCFGRMRCINRRMKF